MALAKPGQLLPVDSEHSALWQALKSGTKNEVSKLILTASGGPLEIVMTFQLSQLPKRLHIQHGRWDLLSQLIPPR
jgi:1-deoxy-D-xylulose-5-phosphate reductoisomerase